MKRIRRFFVWAGLCLLVPLMVLTLVSFITPLHLNLGTLRYSKSLSSPSRLMSVDDSRLFQVSLLSIKMRFGGVQIKWYPKEESSLSQWSTSTSTAVINWQGYYSYSSNYPYEQGTSSVFLKNQVRNSRFLGFQYCESSTPVNGKSVVDFVAVTFPLFIVFAPALVFFGFMWHRKRLVARRLRRHECVKCGYYSGMLGTVRCPECGHQPVT